MIKEEYKYWYYRKDYRVCDADSSRETASRNWLL